MGDVDNTPGQSLFVRLTGPESGKGAAGKWTDAATGEHGDLLDLIAANRRLEALRDVLEEARSFLRLPRIDPPGREQRQPAPAGSPEAARRLWAISRPIVGTLAEAYLRTRGIADLRNCANLRFHPRCWYRGDGDDLAVRRREAWPALIAAVRDGDTSSGNGATSRVHILVKPTRPDLRTNLVVNTDRRTYLLELTATEATWMASVSWDYPQDRLLALRNQNLRAEAAAPVADGVALERLRFRYAISGDNPPWRPLSAFDDGAKVYIQFPAGIAQGELPPLFVVGPTGENQLVNARFRAPYYVVDRLFGAAELRLGGDKQQVVRIERTDGRRRGWFGS